jgi:hypothetical protein
MPTLGGLDILLCQLEHCLWAKLAISCTCETRDDTHVTTYLQLQVAGCATRGYIKPY